MAKEGWGRWGECDERGAINLIDIDKVKGAAQLVCEGRVISLAQPLSPGNCELIKLSLPIVLGSSPERRDPST